MILPQDKDRIPDGVNYIYIPIINDHAPTEAQAKLLMDTVTNPANWPVLIHCTAGRRRSVMVAYAVLRLRGHDRSQAAALLLRYRKEAVLVPAYVRSVEQWLAATRSTPT